MRWCVLVYSSVKSTVLLLVREKVFKNEWSKNVPSMSTSLSISCSSSVGRELSKVSQYCSKVIFCNLPAIVFIKYSESITELYRINEFLNVCSVWRVVSMLAMCVCVCVLFKTTSVFIWVLLFFRKRSKNIFERTFYLACRVTYPV